MSKTVLYFTQGRWNLHKEGMDVMHYGSIIHIFKREMRTDLGRGNDYFEITYRYVG